MQTHDEKYEIKLQRARNWKQNNPQRHAELAKAYRARNREKVKAQNLLNYALRTGKMERKPCEVCGGEEKIHAHHHDYSKPYDVRWLCFLCHKTAHPVTDEEKKVKFAGAKKASLPGESNPNASMSNEDANLVKFLLGMKLSQQCIADHFAVSQATVSRIARGVHYG